MYLLNVIILTIFFSFDVCRTYWVNKIEQKPWKLKFFFLHLYSILSFIEIVITVHCYLQRKKGILVSMESPSTGTQGGGTTSPIILWFHTMLVFFRFAWCHCFYLINLIDSFFHHFEWYIYKSYIILNSVFII